MAGPPKDYEEVPDRLRRFIEKHPDGSLRRVGGLEFRNLPTKNGEVVLHVIYTAAAYRTPEDPAPGIGTACEPIPGLTPFTKGSEVENAETSAWGRALAAVGFPGKKIATQEELNNKIGERRPKPQQQEIVGEGPLDDVAKKQLDDQLEKFVNGRGDIDQLAMQAVALGSELAPSGDPWAKLNVDQGRKLYSFMQTKMEEG